MKRSTTRIHRLANFLSLCVIPLLLSGCREDPHFAMETECELSLRPDGTLIQRMWWRDLRSVDTETNDMQSKLEDVVDVFEPEIFTRTQEDPRKGEAYVLYRKLTTRGEFLDGFEEVELPHAYASKCFREFLTNGCLIMPCLTNIMQIDHNGTLVGMQFEDDEELFPVLMWPTNQSPIWYRNTMITVTGAPLAWVYNEYLDHNHTFPWKTNESSEADVGVHQTF